MSHISSINFKKTNLIQAQHNDRLLPPSYLIGGDFEVNRTSKEALLLKNKMIENAKEAYFEKVGQKFQSKSYEWSAVCNIKSDTTMQELENLAKHFESKYGFQCYQIAIHRDEGHIDKGEKIINHHAHLEFITLDKETGKNNYRRELITPKILRQIQSEVAEILQMERGQDKRITKRERIEPRKWAQMKEKERKTFQKKEETIDFKEKRIQHIKKNILSPIFNELGIETKNATSYVELGKQATQKIVSLKETKARFETYRKEMIEMGYCDKEDYKIRTDLLKETLENAKKKQLTQADLDNAIKELEKQIQERHKEEIEALESKNQALKAEISDLKSKQGLGITQDEFNDLKAKYEAKNKEVELLDSFIKSTGSIETLSNTLKACKTNIEDNKLRAENKRDSTKARLDYAKEVEKNNNEMNSLMDNNPFFERYLFFEHYRELYKNTIEWLKQKAEELTKELTRDRGLDR